MLNDLLFELGTEELPSGAVFPLAEGLSNHLVAALLKANIQHGAVRCFATPRRLAVLILDVQVRQSSQAISRRGPASSAAIDAEGRPTPALLGFAKSCGVTVDALTKSKSDKGEWWVYEGTTAGANTCDLLPTMVNDAVAALPIAKPMRWGNGDAQFARPVHWAVLLFGNEVVNCSVLGVATNRHSYGHRFHHPEAVLISSPRAYEASLQAAHVIADFASRKNAIVTQIQQVALSLGYQAVMPESLLDEVTSIVEWPQVLLANFEKEFLDVPAEALIAAMQSHQKCFALRDAEGHLLPHFITVANIASTNPKQVVSGNEKVMRARLSDAAFFFSQDKRQALHHYAAATLNVVFQQQLGSLNDKMQRIQGLMANLCSPLRLDSTHAKRAAELSKCDLMTGMVGEFPELQGLMGYYYALHDGEDREVAQALNEQYMPRFAADELPKSTLGLALSLADRLDTVVGTFAIGQKPTGVKDPFKLRRHALAIVRLLMTLENPLKISTLIEQTLHLYGEALKPIPGALVEIKPFILERLPSFYHGQGIAADVVHAVLAREDDWLFDIDKRIKALVAFVATPEAISLSAACKRVNNLLGHADVLQKNQAIDESLFEETAEKALFQHIQHVETRVTPRYLEGDYANILSELASLREPVDAFFEQVMVMVEDPIVKSNRLGLLTRLQDLLQGVADISILQLGHE